MVRLAARYGLDALSVAFLIGKQQRRFVDIWNLSDLQRARDWIKRPALVEGVCDGVIAVVGDERSGGA